MFEDLPNLPNDVADVFADLHHWKGVRCAANAPSPQDSHPAVLAKAIETALIAELPNVKGPAEGRQWIALLRTGESVRSYIELCRPDLAPWAKGIEERVRSYAQGHPDEFQGRPPAAAEADSWDPGTWEGLITQLLHATARRLPG